MTRTPPAPEAFAALAPAGFLRRLGAMIYDGLLVTAIWMMTVYVIVAIDGTDEPIAPRVSRVILAAEGFVFYVYFWVRHQRTLALQAWHLRVQQPDGRPITPRQAAMRWFASLPALLLFGLGYLWILIDPLRRSWSDLASGTRLVFVTPDLRRD